MALKEYQMELEQRRGKLALLKDSYEQMLQGIEENEKSLVHHEKAKEIIREVGRKTQEQLQYHISDITSLALEGVFPDPYRLEMEFVQRRNKTECDIYFSRNGERIDPMSASGGGAVDVAAFALRIASWSLQKPNTRPVIILDEPMRFLSEDLQEQASTVLKEISDKLGIQFIIVTHEPTITAYADKVFEVYKSKKTGKSHIRNS